jgi:SOS-response transcriptional repressor LexA
MHDIQEKILQLSTLKNLGSMTLRDIGKSVGASHPQSVRHHMNQLIKRGLIKIDKSSKVIEKVQQGTIPNSNLVAIPILGSANCGEATAIADERVEGYLRVSSSIVKYKKGIFALKAVGNSMNRANIEGNSIEDGDYIIIDSNDRNPSKKQYVLSIIDGCANIKKIMKDKENNTFVLLSESTQDIPPIIIHENDHPEYFVNGRVIQIIKKPKAG